MDRVWRKLLGRPRNVDDPSVFHTMALIPFLAWIGLGADGLSSSSYGPDEAYRALGRHGYLAVFLALAMTFTVLIISAGYSRIIEHFPTGGGGYVVATKLLGPYAGVTSGAALLVDYVLTVTTSVAAGGDALFSIYPLDHFIALKLWVEAAVLLVLIILNLRGVKESVTALMPVFLVFLATHLILIVGGLLSRASEIPAMVTSVPEGLHHGIKTVGAMGLLILFLRAYSLGGGTYTGIEAVSNGLQIMREPRVQTGKRTMLYMGVSLAFTAAGILFCYFVFNVHPVKDLTMNAVLIDAFAGSYRPWGMPIGTIFVVLTLVSEGLLLFVAAQTGFIDGPRVMANMAVDSWLPHRFSSLSDRLTTKDGVVLMGIGAIALLYLLHGEVGALVIMYAINVFIGFSLSNLGMLRFWWQKKGPGRAKEYLIHGSGLILCVGILGVTISEKFTEGAWRTLVVTSVLVVACIFIRRHYRMIARKLRDLDQEFSDLPTVDHHGGEPDAKLPTAVLLVGQYGGVGIHSMLAIHRMLPGYFKNIMFVSVAVIDSGSFKGADEIEALKHSVGDSLAHYVDLARRLGWNSGSATSVGIDPAHEITRLCIEIAKGYPRVMFFAGKLIWQRETWWQRILHNETAFQVQRRLQWKGLPVTVIPLRVR